MNGIIDIELQDTPQIAAEIDFKGEVIRADADALKKEYDSGYSAGHSKGYDEGKTEGYTEGRSAGYAEAESVNPFYYATKLDNNMSGLTFPENYKAVIKVKKAPAVSNYVFHQTTGYKSAQWISEDNSNVIEFAYTHRYTGGSPTLEVVDLSEYNRKFKLLAEAFRGQRKLKSILGALNLSECSTASNINNMVMECSALEDIEFVPETIKVLIEFYWCAYLTDKSVQSIIDGLADLTGSTAQTLSLHTTVIEKLTAEQMDRITAKNWTLS